MRILPKTFKEALEVIDNILKQGDNRYNDIEKEVFLAKALLNKMVFLEEKEMPKIKKPKEDDLQRMGHVQKDEKYIAKALLKQKEFQDNEIFFERRFLGSQPDVLGEKKDVIIPVECCSCRVDKIITYLPESEEIWIITREFSNEKMKWFVFKKGPNWEKFLEVRKLQQKELKQIKSPLDGIMCK